MKKKNNTAVFLENELMVHLKRYFEGRKEIRCPHYLDAS